MNELFKNLMALCDPKDQSKFFYRDSRTPLGTPFRVFSYNYASYSDWLLQDALECRGIMFEVTEAGEPVRIMSRPMEKFFNLNETPFTMNLDMSKVSYGMDKADGSLISTYLDNGIVCAKSKTSVISEQAIAANAILSDITHEALYNRALELVEAGFTLNFEYVAPDNRIVLPYESKALILLNIRENETGEYVSWTDIYKDPVLRGYLVQPAVIDMTNDNWVDKVRATEGIEGFVFVMEDGLKFKLKTDWYVALHRTKDSITKNESLYEAVVSGGSDDLRSLFEADPWALTKIETFEKIYLTYLRESIDTLNALYKELAGKDRKMFATTAQVKLKNTPYLFGVLMKAFEKGIDMETIVPTLGTVFLKNYKAFVPAEYAKEVVEVSE